MRAAHKNSTWYRNRSLLFTRGVTGLFHHFSGCLSLKDCIWSVMVTQKHQSQLWQETNTILLQDENNLGLFLAAQAVMLFLIRGSILVISKVQTTFLHHKFNIFTERLLNWCYHQRKELTDIHIQIRVTYPWQMASVFGSFMTLTTYRGETGIITPPCVFVRCYFSKLSPGLRYNVTIKQHVCNI